MATEKPVSVHLGEHVVAHITPAKPGGKEGVEVADFYTIERHYQGTPQDWDTLECKFFNGQLLISYKGEEEKISLPETAYTNVASAEFNGEKLVVKVAQKDPNSPAMLEKKALDPDYPHPKPLSIRFIGKAAAKKQHPPDPLGHGQPTPAQMSLSGHTRHDDLLAPGEVKGHPHAVMPEAGLAATVASDMPVIIHPGGVVEAPCAGQTVVRDPKSADTRVHLPGDKEVSEGIRGLHVGDMVQGTRDRVLEAEHGTADQSYVKAAREALHIQPGSDQLAQQGKEGEPREEAQEEYEGEEGVPKELRSFEDSHGVRHVRGDFVQEKVGLVTHPLTAAEFYPTADSGIEPISDMKHQLDEEEEDTEVCEICGCLPCQCGKYDKAEEYRAPLEGTEAELKRTGKPFMHHHEKKAPQGRQVHANPRGNRTRVSEDARMAYYEDKPHPGEKLDAGVIEQAVEHHGSSLRRHDKAEKAVMDAAGRKPDEGLPSQRVGHGSYYSGGRVIATNANDAHLTSGRHQKQPHALG